MVVYLDLVFLLNFFVDWLLLLGTNRLCGYFGGKGKTALAAVLGSVYAAACLLPGFSFLGNWYWRIISLMLMSCVAFGITLSALRRGTVFVLLSMALGGISATIGIGGFLAVALSATGVLLLCVIGFRDKLGAVSYVPVEISVKGENFRVMALRDTGNSLRDPVTGMPVLVVGVELAQKITGLTVKQLRQPIQVMGEGILPGSRLVPYRAVGQPMGMLLALRIPNVKIGDQRHSTLVAFAPDRLCCDGAYQALTGGVL